MAEWTTKDVRTELADGIAGRAMNWRAAKAREDAQLAFDDWLAAHDAEVRARALDDAAEALETYARETYWRDDSTFHTINKDAVTDAAKRIRDRARAERGEQ